MTDQNPRAVPGNNMPVIIEEIFRTFNDELPDRLRSDCGEVIDRAKELVENAANVPEVIENEEQEAKATDIVSQMKKHQKVADSRRLGISALPRQSQAIINNFFADGAINPLEKACARIEPGVTKFKRIKAEKELREREERERKAREEAERQRREAEDAARKLREAEAAKLRAQEEEKRAKEAAIKARQDAQDAEDRRVRAEAQRKEQERLAEEAVSKRKKADAERAARKAQDDAEKAQRDRLAALAEAQREREKAAAAKTEVGLAKGDVSDAGRDAKTATNLAAHAEKDVRKAERDSGAKLAAVSGVRGDLGGQSSLRTKWVGIITDRNKLDKKALWDFISDEDLQKALNKFVSVHKGGRQIAGAVIQEESDTAFR